MKFSCSTSAIPGRRSLNWSGPLARRLFGFLLGAACLVGTAVSIHAQSPPNDDFAARIAISGSTNTVAGSNRLASGEPGEPSHAGSPAAASVWWTWVAPDSGRALLTTQGSGFDTVLAVYTGASIQNLVLVAANDDEPGLASSALSFAAVRGTPYHFVVDGLGAVTGDISLAIRLLVPPTNPKIILDPASVTVLDNIGASVTFHGLVTGSLPISFAWQKDGVNLPQGTQASLTLTNVTAVDAGDYRLVATNHYGSDTSAVAVLTVLPKAANDLFATRTPISGKFLSVSGHNLGATLEPGEPMHAAVANGASLWWSWTAPENGLTLIDTAGSTNFSGGILNTVLAVYQGTAVHALTPVAANDDAEPAQLLSSRLYFRALKGLTYQIAVAGAAASGTIGEGAVALNLMQYPDNDQFTNALIFPPGVETVYDDIAGATLQSDEPVHAGASGGRSVWWSWLAPADGVYLLHTAGSLIDTILAVYTGTDLSNLAFVAEDDNRGAEGAALVKFYASRNTSYHFVIDGRLPSGPGQGKVLLTLAPSVAENDNFAERTTISGPLIQIPDSNANATREPGEPNHGGNTGGHSLWWTWTAPVTGPAHIKTLHNTFDTTLAVYTGTQLSSLVLVAENDDALAGAAGASAVIFHATAGQTYQIAVDSYKLIAGEAGTGSFVLSLVQKVAPELGGNDLFVNRFPITGQTNLVIGSNANASKEPGEPAHDGNDGGRSIWWSWVAPASSPVSFSTLDSDFDTVLAVYQGSDLGLLTLIGADSRSADGRSIVTFTAVAGIEYQIAVDGFNNGAGAALGRVALRLRQFSSEPLHANNDFENATPFLDFLAVQSSNIGATRQPGEPAHGLTQQGHSLWWAWKAEQNLPVTISTAGSQFDTILSVYTGSTLEQLSLVAESDDLHPGSEQSSVTFQALAGTVYYIAVDGYANEIGIINLTLSPREDLPAAPFIHQAPIDQTRYLNASGGGPNVTFNALATGSWPLSFQWFFNGTRLDGATNQFLTITNATSQNAGLYQLTVSNSVEVLTTTGATLTWIDSPFNDDFADRILIPGSASVVRGSILGAGKEPGERDHGGELGGASIWWKWIAPASGYFQLDTTGSSFDTVLALYQGTELGQLTLLHENNDIWPAGIDASKVTFHALAGQEYQIAVDGAKTNTSSGHVLLKVTPALPPALLVQPPVDNLVHVTNSAFQLQVIASDPPPLKYQWFFNEAAIPLATNATYALGQLGRPRSGTYTVSVANDIGAVTSSNILVWVAVPQLLRPPQILANGHVELTFADPDGTLSPEPGRFEVQSTEGLSDSMDAWVPIPGGISARNGRFLFEDQTTGEVANRLYRVIEK